MFFLLFVWIDTFFYPDIYIHSDKPIECVLIDDSLYWVKKADSDISVAFLSRNRKFALNFPDIYEHFSNTHMGFFDYRDYIWGNTRFIYYKDRSIPGNILEFLNKQGNKRILVYERLPLKYKEFFELNGVKLLKFNDSLIANLREIDSLQTYRVEIPYPISSGDTLYFNVVFSDGSKKYLKKKLKFVPYVWEKNDKGNVKLGKSLVFCDDRVYLSNGKILYNSFNTNFIKIIGNTIFYPRYSLIFKGYGKWEYNGYICKGNLEDVSPDYSLFFYNNKYYLCDKKGKVLFSFYKYSNMQIFSRGAIGLLNGRINYYGEGNYKWIYRWRDVSKISVYYDKLAVYKNGIIYVLNDKGKDLFEIKFDVGSLGDIILNDKYLVFYNKRGIHVINLNKKQEVFWHRFDMRNEVKFLSVDLYEDRLSFVVNNRLYYRLLP